MQLVTGLETAKITEIYSIIDLFFLFDENKEVACILCKAIKNLKKKGGGG